MPALTGAAEVAPLPGQEEPRRLLLGFAVEQLLAQVEDAFNAAGVRLERGQHVEVDQLHRAVGAAGQERSAVGQEGQRPRRHALVLAQP